MSNINRHLPREVHITLMTREINNINELESMLDVLQNIGERDIGRRPNTPVVPHQMCIRDRLCPVGYKHLNRSDANNCASPGSPVLGEVFLCSPAVRDARIQHIKCDENVKNVELTNSFLFIKRTVFFSSFGKQLLTKN